MRDKKLKISVSTILFVLYGGISETLSWAKKLQKKPHCAKKWIFEVVLVHWDNSRIYWNKQESQKTMNGTKVPTMQFDAIFQAPGVLIIILVTIFVTHVS